MNVTRYTSEAARGVLLLANTSLIFCTFSSNFGRLAYELLITNQQPVARPPIGTDPRAHPPRPTAALLQRRGEGAVTSPTVAAVSLDLPWFAYP